MAVADVGIGRRREFTQSRQRTMAIDLERQRLGGGGAVSVAVAVAIGKAAGSSDAVAVVFVAVVAVAGVVNAVAVAVAAGDAVSTGGDAVGLARSVWCAILLEGRLVRRKRGGLGLECGVGTCALGRVPGRQIASGPLRAQPAVPADQERLREVGLPGVSLPFSQRKRKRKEKKEGGERKENPTLTPQVWWCTSW